MGKLSHASARRSGSCEAARPDSNPQLCGCPSRCGPPLLPSSHPQAKHLWRACCVRRGTTPPTRARTGSRSDTSVLTRGAGAAPFAGESSAGAPHAPLAPQPRPEPGNRPRKRGWGGNGRNEQCRERAGRGSPRWRGCVCVRLASLGEGVRLCRSVSGSFWDPGGYRRSLWVSGRLQSC